LIPFSHRTPTSTMDMFSYYLRRSAPGNVAVWDRVLRAVPAVTTAALYAVGVIGGGLALALGIASGMLLATSLTGKCSVYYAAHTGTRRDADGRRVTGRPHP
jgi:hypothetical protein